MLKVCDHLRQNLAAKPCLDQLAQIASTNRNSLNHDFLQVYGMTVFDWLREQRLVQAAHLLHTTDTPVLAVAEQVGYTSHASFSKAFHQRFGFSPREYRAHRSLPVAATKMCRSDKFSCLPEQ